LGHIDDSDGGTRIRTDYREITDGLAEQQEEYRVEYLDNREQTERYNKLRKEFAILRIRPIQSDGSLLSIQVSVSYLTHEKGKFLHAISDWSDVEFRSIVKITNSSFLV
jgi:hypothetical protein